MTNRKQVIGSACAATVALTLVMTAAPAEAARLPIAGKTASARVAKAVPGTVSSIRAVKRDGLAAWAVTIMREDGSIVVGYVDRRSGIVFDWTVQQAANEPIIDLDGPDTSRKAAPPPPTIGLPLPETAQVDRHPATPVPAAPATPASPAPSMSPSPAPTDDDGSDETHRAPAGHHAPESSSSPVRSEAEHHAESPAVDSHDEHLGASEQPRSEQYSASDDHR